jgi:hypothetical protein
VSIPKEKWTTHGVSETLVLFDIYAPLLIIVNWCIVLVIESVSVYLDGWTALQAGITEEEEEELHGNEPMC